MVDCNLQKVKVFLKIGMSPLYYCIARLLYSKVKVSYAFVGYVFYNNCIKCCIKWGSAHLKPCMLWKECIISIILKRVQV